MLSWQRAGQGAGGTCGERARLELVSDPRTPPQSRWALHGDAWNGSSLLSQSDCSCGRRRRRQQSYKRKGLLGKRSWA